MIRFGTILYICVTLLCACNKDEHNSENSVVARPDVAILSADSAATWATGFPASYKSALLTESELSLIDSLINVALAERHIVLPAGDTLKQPNAQDITATLADYKRQYLAVTNARGQKEVWVNCFCKSIEKRIEFSDWQKMPVKVIGGGHCFFNVKIDLQQKRVYDFRTNESGS